MRRLKELGQEFTGRQIEIVDLHSFRNGHLNRLTTFHAGDLQSGAAVIDREVMSAVRTVENDIRYPDLVALFRFLRNRLFCRIVAHTTPPDYRAKVDTRVSDCRRLNPKD
jgi:hypothetical protein